MLVGDRPDVFLAATGLAGGTWESSTQTFWPGIEGMVQTARDADVNLLIYGCPVECAKRVFEKAGLTNFACVKVTDLGIEKKKGVSCTRAEIDRVLVKAREVLAAAK